MRTEISTIAKVRFSDCDPLGHLNNVKYLEYMLNAREDHIKEFFGFTYGEYFQKTGCSWVAIQNEIAYIKEAHYDSNVLISSKIIEMNEKISKVEITMKSEDGEYTHAVLWITLIYFNLKTRKTDSLSAEEQQFYADYVQKVEQKDFQSRATYFRIQNKNI